jgi:hypothetical protein
MSFHSVRLLRKISLPARVDLRAASTGRCKSSEWSFNSVEIQSQGSKEQDATIIALLDRDSELRHLYLQRRWQGVIG